MHGRVVLITGSTRGIGLELARACVARGARVIVHGRDRARVEAIAHELGCFGIAFDLVAADGPESLIRRALENCGRLDVLVNNAGIGGPRAPLWEASIGDVLATNVVAAMRCTRALLTWAVPRGEPVRIVNVSSGIVALPRAHAAEYVASKAALDGFTRALALDLAATASVVTGVALGSHATELARDALGAGELPPARAAVPLLVRAIEAPAEDVHGRILAPAKPPLDRDRIDLFAHPLGPSPRALAALARVEQLDRYPDPACLALRKVLAAKHEVALDAIVVGAGASELLDRVLAVATRPGETVVANAPSWPLWAHACRARGVAWRQVPYRLARGRADHDLDAIRAAIDRSVRLVYLTSPANPGGAALDAGELAQFAAAVPRHVTIVVDEAYLDHATRGDAANTAALVRWIDTPVVALRSFSKFHALAGLRIGYAVATREIARELAREAPPFVLARGAEEAALAALADHEHARRVAASITSARSELERRLDARGIERLASDGPFVLAADPTARGPRLFDRFAMIPIHEERHG